MVINEASIDRVLTVKEACAYLRVGKTVLYPLLKERGFRKVGGQYRLRKGDLDAMMAPGYDAPAGAPSEQQEGACLTKEVAPRTGGSLSREFDSLLGLTTTKPPRRLRAA